MHIRHFLALKTAIKDTKTIASGMKNVLPAVHKPMVFDEQTAQLAFLTIEKYLQQRHKPLGINTLAKRTNLRPFS